jgi:hypothetical protein
MFTLGMPTSRVKIISFLVSFPEETTKGTSSNYKQSKISPFTLRLPLIDNPRHQRTPPANLNANTTQEIKLNKKKISGSKNPKA